ncbi:MAG: D-alanine--D-alanine ligase [Verrucomicrobiota bacterium]
MDQKLNVGIVFGGKSAEHEVSLQSAKNIIEALDRSKYNPVLIGIDKTGKWHLNEGTKFLLHAEDPKLIKLNESSTEIVVAPECRGELANPISQQKVKLDVVFPVLHGTFGEDGTIQGLLKLANIPFVGADVLGSAIGMDKDVMKRLLREAKLPVAKFIVLRKHESAPSYQAIAKKVGKIFFVKPANLGSSVGVSKVKNKNEYLSAVREAFEYDNKILIEEFIPCREIECSVLGNENPIASLPGEVIPTHEFYSYESKYIDPNGANFHIPAKLNQKTIKRIQELAIAAFKTLSCHGMARVDFFLKKNGTVYINEINTIPGFTKISMYPKLWEASGISYTELLNRLIQLALDKYRQEQKLKTSFN